MSERKKEKVYSSLKESNLPAMEQKEGKNHVEPKCCPKVEWLNMRSEALSTVQRKKKTLYSCR